MESLRPSAGPHEQTVAVTPDLVMPLYKRTIDETILHPFHVTRDLQPFWLPPTAIIGATIPTARRFHGTATLPNFGGAYFYNQEEPLNRPIYPLTTAFLLRPPTVATLGNETRVCHATIYCYG